MRNKKSASHRCRAAVITTLCSAAAGAQTTPPGPPVQPQDLPSITVTAEKMGRTVEQTLSSAAVTTARGLAEHGDHTLTDVMARTPGVTTAPDNQAFSIRGMPVAGLGEEGANDLISVYVDGAVQPRQNVTLGTLSTWDMEQVEILRGPQSTVQGRNAMAGAIVLQSKLPSFKPTVVAEGRAGRFGERGGAFVLSGPVVAEQVAVRLAVEHTQDDGYIRNATLGGNANAHRNTLARGKILWQPTDRFDAIVTLANTDHRRGNPVITQDENDRPQFYRLYTDVDAYDRMRQNSTSVQLAYRVDPHWTLTSVTAVTRTRYDSVLDFNQTAEPPLDEVFRDHRHALDTQEMRLAYRGDTLQGQFGLYAANSQSDRDDRLDFDRSFYGHVKEDTRVNSRAAFGELNWTFVPRWQLITGVRYDRETFHQRADSFFVEDGASGSVTSATSDVWLPRVGLSHEPLPGHLLGLVVQRSYRGGGASFNIATQRSVAFDPEFATNYELSHRGRWLDKRLQTQVNAYRMRWTDQQVVQYAIPGDQNSAEVANAGRSLVKGLELSATYDINRTWRVFGGAALNHTRYRSYVTTTEDLSGQAFQQAPRRQVNAGVRWRDPRGWMLNVEALYRSASNSEYTVDSDETSPRFRQVVGVRRADAITLVNASAQYRIGAWLLSAYVKNLFDRQYLYSRPSGSVVTSGAPRTLGIAARWELP